MYDLWFIEIYMFDLTLYTRVESTRTNMKDQ